MLHIELHDVGLSHNNPLDGLLHTIHITHFCGVWAYKIPRSWLWFATSKKKTLGFKFMSKQDHYSNQQVREMHHLGDRHVTDVHFLRLLFSSSFSNA